MTAASFPPANWHPNPENAAEWRYWDGASWTDRVHPVGSVEFGSVLEFQRDM